MICLQSNKDNILIGNDTIHSTKVESTKIEATSIQNGKTDNDKMRDTTLTNKNDKDIANNIDIEDKKEDSNNIENDNDINKDKVNISKSNNLEKDNKDNNKNDNNDNKKEEDNDKNEENENENENEEQDDIAPIVINENISKKKRKGHKKQDSRIDIKDLMKFENFTQKMNEKEAGLIINVKIKSMDTQFPIIKVEIDQNSTVLDLKNKICDESPDKIASLRQRLIHKGRLIKDVRTLKQYNIQNEETMMLVRSRRNQTKQSHLKRPKNNHIVNGSDDRFNPRQRAMTLGTNQSIQRSKTPEPQQISQMY